jgi:phage gpG-like protein
MAGVQLTLEARELPEVVSVFQALEERVADTEPLMQIFAAYGEESTRARFLDQKDPDGKPWKPSRRAEAEGGSTLIDSGDLERSITHEADPRQAVWGVSRVNNVEKYARIHNDGGVIRPKTAKALRFRIPGLGWRSAKQVIMPKRTYLGVNAADRAEMDARATEYLTEAFPS